MMKTTQKIWTLTLILGSLLQAQEIPEPPGFIDENQDGINDHFCDANGDGINDVTGKPYPHAFEFRDDDKDGVNDLWRDADGDGVNDLLGQFERQMWIDMDGDGIRDEGRALLRGEALKKHVLDMNGDGRNDITGEPVTGNSLGGYRYGLINEEAGTVSRGYSDMDGDGRNDRSMNRGENGSRGEDVFIDEDGDGISDGRGLGRNTVKPARRNKK